MAAARKTVTAEFEKVAETKGTHRFQEIVAEGAEPVIGSLYVRKAAIGTLGSPEKIKVTVESFG